ncbi:MAG TPA: ice-binding family protein [Chthoniobacterales bacterium]
MRRSSHARFDAHRQVSNCESGDKSERTGKPVKNPTVARIRARTSDAVRMAAFLVAGLLAPSWSPVAAQTVSLGAAQNTAVLGGATVTNTGATTVIGNVGVSPGTAVTGFPPGIVRDGTIHSNDTLAVQAHADASTAYATLAGEAPTANLSGTDLGGLTLSPGVYHFDTSAQLTGTLSLNTVNDPNGTFIFQVGSTLTTASNSTVTLLGGTGADANIFWQVGSSATIGPGSVFSGNILAHTSITLNSGAEVAAGKALALNGAVTMDTNYVNGPGTPKLLTNGDFESAPAQNSGNVTTQGWYTQSIANSTTGTFTSNGWTFGRTNTAGGSDPTDGPRVNWFKSTDKPDWIAGPASGNFGIQLNTAVQGATTQVYVQQTVSLVAGTHYSLTFEYAGETGTTGPGGLEVQVTGSASVDTSEAFASTAYQTGTVNFTALSSGPATIRFLDNATGTAPTYNAVLDNVTLQEVTPEPTTLGFGAVLVGAVAWRERQRIRRWTQRLTTPGSAAGRQPR